MAVAMSGIGVLAILGRQLVDRRLEGHEENHRHFTNCSRIAGNAAVLLIGLGLFGLTLSYDAGRVPTESITAQRAAVK